MSQDARDRIVQALVDYFSVKMTATGVIWGLVVSWWMSRRRFREKYRLDVQAVRNAALEEAAVLLEQHAGGFDFDGSRFPDRAAVGHELRRKAAKVRELKTR